MMTGFLPWPYPQFDQWKATELITMTNIQSRWMIQFFRLVHMTGKYSDCITPKLCVP